MQSSRLDRPDPLTVNPPVDPFQSGTPSEIFRHTVAQQARIARSFLLGGIADDGSESLMSAATAVSRIHVDHAPQPAASASTRRIAEQIRNQGSACVRIHTRNKIARLRPGDQAFIRKWEFMQVAVGDVIAYERGSRLYIQRVLRRALMPTENGRCSFLVTRDDANINSLVSAQEFLGRATRIHRRNRHIDLESMGQVLVGRIIAIVSRWRRVAHGPRRVAKHPILSTTDRAHS
jgi:hypothetical protein